MDHIQHDLPNLWLDWLIILSLSLGLDAFMHETLLRSIVFHGHLSLVLHAVTERCAWLGVIIILYIWTIVTTGWQATANEGDVHGSILINRLNRFLKANNNEKTMRCGSLSQRCVPVNGCWDQGVWSTLWVQHKRNRSMHGGKTGWQQGKKNHGLGRKVRGTTGHLAGLSKRSTGQMFLFNRLAPPSPGPVDTHTVSMPAGTGSGAVTPYTSWKCNSYYICWNLLLYPFSPAVSCLLNLFNIK